MVIAYLFKCAADLTLPLLLLLLLGVDYSINQ